MMKKTEKSVMLKRGQTVAFISALANLLLAVMKGVVGVYFGAQILIADALHSGADLLTHAASGFGLWLSSREKTAKFPYGLYRAETLACLLVGGFIIVAGVEMFGEGWHKLFHPAPETTFPMIPMVASLVSAACAFVVSRLEAKVGKSIGSRSLVANSKEAFLDIFTSIIVLVGLLMAYFRIPHVEGGIIIMISILLFKLGVENVWTSLLILLDANLAPDLQAEIEERINGIYGVKGTSEVKIRQAGPFYMVECVIATHPSLSLYRAHELADRVESLTTQNYDRIESVFVHVEPSRDTCRQVMIPVQNIDGMKSRVHGHFARAPFFMLLKLDHDRAEIEDFYYNEFLGDDKHIGVKIARMVIHHRVDVVVTAGVGEIAYHMMKDNLIDFYKADEAASVESVLADYRQRQIPSLPGPTHTVETSLATNAAQPL